MDLSLLQKVLKSENLDKIQRIKRRICWDQRLPSILKVPGRNLKITGHLQRRKHTILLPRQTPVKIYQISKRSQLKSKNQRLGILHHFPIRKFWRIRLMTSQKECQVCLPRVNLKTIWQSSKNLTRWDRVSWPILHSLSLKLLNKNQASILLTSTFFHKTRKKSKNQIGKVR